MFSPSKLAVMALIAFLYSTAGLQAQKEPSPGSSIEGTVGQFKTNLDSLTARFERGQISREEFENGVEAAARMMGDSISSTFVLKKVIVKTSDKDELEDAFSKEDILDIDFDFEDNSTESDTGENKIRIRIGDKETRKGTTGFFLLNFGPNIAETPFDGLAPASPEFEPWRSWTVNMGLLGSTRLGGPRSWFWLNYGLKFKAMGLRNEEDLVLQINDKNPVFIPFDGGRIRDVNFTRYTLDIPLQLRIAGPKAKSLNVILGGYGGIRLGGNQSLRYRSYTGERARLELTDDYRIPLWHYGLTAAVGQRWWQVYADYELNNLFRENPLYSYKIFNTGIQFSF